MSAAKRRYGHPTDDGVVNKFGVVSEDVELKRTYKECDHCSIPISTPPSKNTKYCSDYCWNASENGNKMMCPECHFKAISVGRMRSHFESSHSGNWFETVANCEIHYNVESLSYGPGWTHSKKEAVRERDDFECQDCGIGQDEYMAECGRRLDVHHIQKARNISDAEERNSMDNLITVCRSCHAKWEDIPLRPVVG